MGKIILIAFVCMAFTCSPLDSEEYFPYQANCEWGFTFDDFAAPHMDSAGVKPSGLWGYYYFFIIDSVIFEGDSPCRYKTHAIEHAPDGSILEPCHVNWVAVWCFQQSHYYNPVSGRWTVADQIIDGQPIYKQGDTVAIRANVIEGNITWWN